MPTAAALVEEARTVAGLSRRGLAMRAGVPTSTVSRVESGEVDPTLTMLERLLAAAGQQLALTCAPLAEQPSLARLADAYDASRRGTMIDWTRLRGIIGWLRRHPQEIESAIAAPPPRTGTVLDAILAAMAEKLAADADVAVPRWTAAVGALATPWRPPGTPAMVKAAERTTPEPFRRRNIILSELALWRPAA